MDKLTVKECTDMLNEFVAKGYAANRTNRKEMNHVFMRGEEVERLLGNIESVIQAGQDTAYCDALAVYERFLEYLENWQKDNRLLFAVIDCLKEIGDSEALNEGYPSIDKTWTFALDADGNIVVTDCSLCDEEHADCRHWVL